MPHNINKVGGIISAIGGKAGVITATVNKPDPDKPGRTIDVPKFASAHDLRRAFGVRWSRKFRPNVLKQLMRHASIQTTMDFYANEDADAVAAEIWTGSGGNISGNSEPVDVQEREKGSEQECPKPLSAKDF